MSGWFYSIADAKRFLGFQVDGEELKAVAKEKQVNYTKGKQFTESEYIK